MEVRSTGKRTLGRTLKSQPIALCQQHLPVQLVSAATKSRWKFYALFSLSSHSLGQTEVAAPAGCFTPVSEHRQAVSAFPKATGATRGRQTKGANNSSWHERCQSEDRRTMNRSAVAAKRVSFDHLSARASKEGGTVRSSALAVFLLITNSNLLLSGRSAGFVPRKILSTISAARRYMSGTFGP